MGKKRSHKKRKHSSILPGNTATAVVESGDEAVSALDVATTVRVLHLWAHPPTTSSLGPAARKQLRQALHPIVIRQLQDVYDVPDYSGRVTLALQRQQWHEAQVALRACTDLSRYPKPGTMQRWVRAVDEAPERYKHLLLTKIVRLAAASASSSTSTPDAGCGGGSISSNTATNNNQRDDCQHLLLEELAKRGTLSGERYDVEDDNDDDNDEDEDDDSSILVEPGWKIPSFDYNGTSLLNPASVSSSQEEHDEESVEPVVMTKKKIAFRIVYSEKANQRTPPNRHDLLLHTTAPGSMQWDDNDASCNGIRKSLVPFVPGAFGLAHVLSRQECQQLIQCADTMGFRPDHPITIDTSTGIDSCEWLVDDSIAGPLWERVRDHLPVTPPPSGGGTANNMTLAGLNARWRCFRYAKHAVYRPHIDGSWPDCRLAADGTYHTNQNGRSYYTFLLYLNDDFEGGETVFYSSNDNDSNGSSQQSKKITARGIVPTAGCVLVFPQGNLASLVHEGAAVTRGTKYIIRTDVVYELSTST
jgi:hypothetical protein